MRNSEPRNLSIEALNLLQSLPGTVGAYSENVESASLPEDFGLKLAYCWWRNQIKIHPSVNWRGHWIRNGRGFDSVKDAIAFGVEMALEEEVKMSEDLAFGPSD